MNGSDLRGHAHTCTNTPTHTYTHIHTHTHTHTHIHIHTRIHIHRNGRILPVIALLPQDQGRVGYKAHLHAAVGVYSG